MPPTISRATCRPERLGRLATSKRGEYQPLGPFLFQEFRHHGCRRGVVTPPEALLPFRTSQQKRTGRRFPHRYPTCSTTADQGVRSARPRASRCCLITPRPEAQRSASTPGSAHCPSLREAPCTVTPNQMIAHHHDGGVQPPTGRLVRNPGQYQHPAPMGFGSHPGKPPRGRRIPVPSSVRRGASLSWKTGTR